MPARPKLYLRSYPVPDDMRAHASAVEEDGWDGLLFNDTQNLGMDVFGSLYLAASATSQLELGTAVTNLITRHPAVMASAFATLHHGMEHAAQAEVMPADFLSRFCVIGAPDHCIERLCELVDLGLSHLVIVGGSRDIDNVVRERSDHLVAREVLPALLAL